MGGIKVVTLRTATTGRPAYGCTCLQEWLPLVEKVAIKRGLVQHRLDVIQGCMWSYVGGTGASASAGTHNTGGVLDMAQYSDAAVKLYREAGAAAWHRTPAQGFSGHHCHLVLIGCPHDTSAAYQVAAYRAGRNGLASGAADDGPRVSPIRTWEQGITWLKRQLDSDTEEWTMADIKAVFTTDGIIPALSSEANKKKNPFWTFRGWLQSSGERLIRIEKGINKILQVLEAEADATKKVL